jgi:NitT/TauT family transport system substrate-binding protein
MHAPRRVLLAIALLLLGIPAGQAAEIVQATPLRVGKGGQNAFSFTLLDLGIAEGLFGRHGLDVQSVDFSGGTRVQQALVAGSIDLGLAGGTDLGALANGAPVKAVAAMADRPLDFAITVNSAGKLRGVADLKGARIGVTTLSSLTAWLTGEVSRRQGWGPDGIIRVAAGNSATAYAMLHTGALEGVAGDLGSGLQAEKRGDGRVLLRFGDLIPKFQVFVIYAPDAVLAAKPDAVRAFLAGWFDTIAFLHNNRAESVTKMAGLMGLDPDVMGELYDQLLPMFSADGKFDPQAMAVLSRALSDQFGVKPDDLARYTTSEFLPARP